MGEKEKGEIHINYTLGMHTYYFCLILCIIITCILATMIYNKVSQVLLRLLQFLHI